MLEKTIQIDKKLIENNWCFSGVYGSYKIDLYKDTKDFAEIALKENKMKGFPYLNEVEYGVCNNQISFYFGLNYSDFFERDGREKEEVEKDLQSHFIKITYEFPEQYDIKTVKNILIWEECDDPYYGYFLDDTEYRFKVNVYLVRNKNYKWDDKVYTRGIFEE